MKTINEVAKLSGVSVRTLHYYDEIGLLHPDKITSSGYRLYSFNNLEKLQQILFFRELEFSLKNIKKILDDPNFDKKEALKNHQKLLKIKKDRLVGLIELTDKILKGEMDMSFNEFDLSDFEKAQKQYANEVKERFGDTDAYKESAYKTNKYTKSDWERINSAAEKIYQEFIKIMDKGAESNEAQNLVIKWKNYITENFYTCTDEILAGLGQMYVADQRFTKNIDKYQDGLASFISRAIEIYCAK